MSGFEKILTRDIYDLYEGQTCDEGFSFNDSVLPCIMDYGKRFSIRDMVAGSQSSYRKFFKLYLKYLEHMKF